MFTNKRLGSNLSFTIFLIVIGVFTISSCKRAAVFDKEDYLKRCHISLDGMLLADDEIDSLLTSLQLEEIAWATEYNLNKPELKVFNLQDIDTCFKLYSDLTNDLRFSRERETRTCIINHLYARLYSLINDRDSLLDITIIFSKTRPSDERVTIGESSYFYSCRNNDSLALESVFRIVEGLFQAETLYENLDNKSLTKNVAKDICRWCTIGLPLEQSYYQDKGVFNLLYSLAIAGYAANSPEADNYADSLFLCIKRRTDSSFNNTGRFRFSGAIRKRYDSAIIAGDLALADDILDYYLSNYFYLPQKSDWEDLFPHDLNTYISERVDPDDSISLSDNLNVSNSFMRLFSSVLHDYSIDHGELMDNTTICCFEKAKTCYLRKDTLFSRWLTNGFFRGIDETFPSMTGWEYVDDLLSPDHKYSSDLIKLMRYQYNNQDPKLVYDALLYIKGASDRIPIELFTSISNSCPPEVVAYADSIRRFGIPHWGHLTERDYLEKMIGPKLKSILSQNILSWDAVKSCLAPNEIAIEFYACPTLSTREKIIYKAAVLCADYDTPLIIALCDDQQLRDYFKKGMNASYLYSLIWRPLEKVISAKDVVYYSTDGFLDICNLQAARTDDDGLMMDKYQMYLLSSTREIPSIQSKHEYSLIALFGGLNYEEDYIAPSEKEGHSKQLEQRFFRTFDADSFDYLPYSKKEVIDISKIAHHYGLLTQLFVDQFGTEEAFNSLSGGKDNIIHIATHGFYYSTTEYKILGTASSSISSDPLTRCGLVMSRGQHAWEHDIIPDNVEDGILEGREICKLDLHNVDLVVLSACNTALGDFSPEGISGLRSAFKRAGVGSIIMTIGKIDDEASATFMNLFYQNLFLKGNKYDAFRNTISSMRQSNKYHSPQFWSKFVLID